MVKNLKWNQEYGAHTDSICFSVQPLKNEFEVSKDIWSEGLDMKMWQAILELTQQFEVYCWNVSF